MRKCLICSTGITITSCHCKACNTSYKREFSLPRLARLSQEEQLLAEGLILHGGNLKEMADTLDISYPTLKKRLNELTSALQNKKDEDEQRVEKILDEIASKKLGAEEGIAAIREINGEL